MNKTQNYLGTAVLAVVIAGFTANAAQADITGNINTALTNSNLSTDAVTYASANTETGPFPLLTVGEFDFSLPFGAAITGGTLSGDFGSNALASSTSQVALYADGIAVATCDANCEAATQFNDVAWTYTFSAADLASLRSNAQWTSFQLVLTAQQLDAYQVVLDPTSVTLTTVPVPGAVWLFGSALMAGLGFSRRKAV